MYEALLGRDGFRKGMDLYWERHDGQVGWLHHTARRPRLARVSPTHLDLTSTQLQTSNLNR